MATVLRVQIHYTNELLALAVSMLDQTQHPTNLRRVLCFPQV